MAGGGGAGPKVTRLSGVSFVVQLRIALFPVMLTAWTFVIDGATLHGGDLHYLYRGKYQLNDQGGISVTVQVDNYSGQQNAVVGPFQSFRLTLTGPVLPQGFTLSGAVQGDPTRMIHIDLVRISDLIAQTGM